MEDFIKDLPEGRAEDHVTAGDTKGEAPILDISALNANAGWSGFLRNQNGQYFSINNSGYAVPSNSSSATKLSMFSNGGSRYLIISTGPWSGYYLTYSDNFYIMATRRWDFVRYVTGGASLSFINYPGTYHYQGYICANGHGYYYNYQN